MSPSRDTTTDRWSDLGRSELIALGKTMVTDRLEALGCTVKGPSNLTGGKLDVQTPSGRSAEVFVSTQRLGGYVFWTRRRLQPANNRFAAIVLLGDVKEPYLYLVPSTSGCTPPLPSRIVTTSASAASRSTGSRSRDRLSPRSSDTCGTTRRPVTSVRSPADGWAA